MEATDGSGRVDDALRNGYAQVLARIERAARAAGRDPRDIALLAVSKTVPAERVMALAALGQCAFGESYVQEAVDKIARCQALNAAAEAAEARGREQRLEQPVHGRLEWHFIGPIQSNKTRAIAEHFDWVHGVDREKIARRLAEQRPEALGPLQVCIQVNVSGEASKSGCAPDEAPALARAVLALPRLRLRGLMAIPEPTEDAILQRARFDSLARLASRIRDAGIDIDTLSMGMSDDLEQAIAAGATIVRIGTAIFGARPTGRGAPDEREDGAGG